MDHTTSRKCFRRLLVTGLWIVALDFATLPGASAGDFDLSCPGPAILYNPIGW